MDARFGFDDFQLIPTRLLAMLPSLKLPVAVYCLVVPTAMVEFAGVTAIETRLAPVTVSDEVPLTEPDAAVMVVVPAATPLASPVESTLATDGEVDDQVNDGNSWVL